MPAKKSGYLNFSKVRKAAGEGVRLGSAMRRAGDPAYAATTGDTSRFGQPIPDQSPLRHDIEEWRKKKKPRAGFGYLSKK